ncbi:MAG: hypothetical protein ACI9YP_000414 [Colwellia sp.]|jgi:hypothetical protein
MKHKFFKLTCVCLMTLVFGMKLAAAGPILLTFDWTGQCDDCQGPNGAIDVPGTNWFDGYTQDVSGLLKVNYDPDIDPLFGSQFELVSFVYDGSSIVHPAYNVPNPNPSRYGGVGKDYWWSLSIRDSVVYVDWLFTWMSPLQYKGDFSDLNVGDAVDAYGPHWFVDHVYTSFNNDYADGGWNLRFAYNAQYNPPYVPPIRTPGGGGGRGGGSRDEGWSNEFVMRGTLPSPLASPIPEPSTIAIFALGMVGLSLRRQKRI